MKTAHSEHDARILDQFTRQANPFADLAAHSPRALMALCLECAQLQPQHDVLDVACGPGLLVAALAGRVHHVTGVDFVPAMLERARLEQNKAGHHNVTFAQADARALPYPDTSFDRVLTRFSFHHMEEPARVLAELIRVTKRGGLVMVIDATPDADKRAAYDAFEQLRDPSHTSALTSDELTQLFREQGLTPRVTPFRLQMELEQQLAASFPLPGDGERVRALMERDAHDGVDRLSMAAHVCDGQVRFSYPCSIVVAERT